MRPWTDEPQRLWPEVDGGRQPGNDVAVRLHRLGWRPVDAKLGRRQECRVRKPLQPAERQRRGKAQHRQAAALAEQAELETRAVEPGIEANARQFEANLAIY